MRANNMLGVLFSNVHDENIRELTEKRAMGSVPFGGRYRLIDFPLSNMVNSGINKVGVITKNNYQSLMDHLGSGKAWDLSRKREGLFILPPFSLSALVKTMAKGTPFSPSHSMKARSMACGSWRLSTRTKRLVICSRCRM